MSDEVTISEIQVIPVKPRDGLIGFASFVLDKKYYVGSVAVYTRLNGASFRLVYPTKKVGVTNINTFHPLNAVVGKKIEEEISNKVNEILYDRKDETIQSAMG